MYRIQTMNKISPVGLRRLDPALYQVAEEMPSPQAILVRSAKLLDMDFGPELLAIARAGVGVNNIPLEVGIFVVYTPVAHANAVQEFVLCDMLIASRDVTGAARWVREQAESGAEVASGVEKGKSAFAGPELYRKTLGIIGLGAIGSLVANAAVALGMDVYGYDPYLSVETALRLDRHVHVVKDAADLYKRADYITLHLHLTPETTHMIDAAAIAQMKRGVRPGGDRGRRGHPGGAGGGPGGGLCHRLPQQPTAPVVPRHRPAPSGGLDAGERAELRRHGGRRAAGLSGKRKHPLQRQFPRREHGPQRRHASVHPA